MLQFSEVFALSSEITAVMACVAFIVTYAILAEWHKSLDGQLMMMVSAGNACKATCNIALVGAWGDPSKDWIRVANAAFTLVIGLFFGIMAWRVWKAQTTRRST